MATLDVAHIVKRHSDRPGVRAAVDDVSFRVDDGELLAITGKSGSGKSTILSILGLLDRADRGTYRFDGEDVTQARGARAARLRNAHIGFVFQSWQLLAGSTALENISLPALYAGDARRAAELKARHLLDRFGLSHLARRRPAELSGGQRQMVAICRSLVNDPGLILADEPTGSLDSESAAAIVDHLIGLNRRGCTLVMVTHDLQLAARCDRQIRIADGALASGDDPIPGRT